MAAGRWAAWVPSTVRLRCRLRSVRASCERWSVATDAA
eukprot:gene42408-26875_t